MEEVLASSGLEEPQNPPTLESLLADLKGFGIEALETPIEIKASGRTVHLKLSNIPTESDLKAQLAAEGLKGQMYMSRIKAEILSYAISWLDGLDVSKMADVVVLDPVTQEERPFREALRDSIMGWGEEVKNVLWKVMMVHCQSIEDRLYESLPTASVMTEIEQRFLENAMQEIAEVQRETYQDAIKEIVDKATGDETSS